MAKQRPQRLVIVANVARAAGESIHPVSSACRRFLATVLTVGYHVVMTSEIRQEWQQHRSGYSRRWLQQMYGRRYVHKRSIERDEHLRRRICNSVKGKQGDTVAKDLHLIEAAIATDRLISSGDEHARMAFRSASKTVAELSSVTWINPGNDQEDAVNWLRSGARAQAHLLLGA